VWMRFFRFLRRNALILLFFCVIVRQMFTCRAIVSLEETVEHWGCGTRSSPCRVVTVPDR
jgi:hypothetical protein